MYQRRMKILTTQVRSHGWEALWIVSTANRRYLTGFSGSAGWLVMRAQGQPVIITDGRYAEQMKQESPWMQSIICQSDPHQFLGAYLRRHNIRRVAFEDENVTVRSWKKLRRLVPGLKGSNASGCVEALRLCKTAEELRYIKKAVKIAEKAYARLLPNLKVNQREIEVALRLEKEMIAAGGQGTAFPTIVASGHNAACPHNQPTQRRLRAGDLVVLDFGCKYKGYHSDLTRTIAIARMTVKQQELYKCVKNAQVFAQKELISGNFVSEVDKKAREILKKYKLNRYFIHSLGHGLGLEIHEAPKLSAFSKERLIKDMVVTCEPGIYLPRWGGIRIEDDVLVGDRNAIWLSSSPQDLIVAGRR